MKKIIFTTLVTVTSTAAAALAVRAIEAVWRRTRHERPPALSKWVKLIAGPMLGKPIAKRLGTPA